MASKRKVKPAAPVVPPAATPEFAELLKRLADPDQNIQADAYYQLDNMPWAEADNADEIARALIDARPPVSVFIERLFHEDLEVRKHAIRYVDTWGDESEEVIAALTAFLRDSHSDVRNTAASALGRKGPAAWPAIPSLFALATMPLPPFFDFELKYGRNTARNAIAELLGVKNIEFDNFRSYKDLIITLKAQGCQVPSLEDIHSYPRAKYAALSQELAAENHVFREELAKRLGPALNERLKEMPHETLEEKKELGRWVNAELKPLGLAVKCPNTGLPARLMGVAGNYRPWEAKGSFCYEIYQDGKQRKTSYSDTLPELTLTDASPPEPGKDWQQAVGPKGSRVPRRR